MPALAITLALPLPDTAKLTPKIRDAICHALELQNRQTLQTILRDKLSLHGPNTLGIRTGKLRDSLTATTPQIQNNTIATTITAPVPYARAHEYGYKGPVTIRPHTRTTKTHTGKKITTLIHAHTTRMNLPQRSFIRSTLAQRAHDYKQAIAAAINNT